MEWTNNMSQHGPAEITSSGTTQKDYTCVTFYPDLQRFGMQEFDEDTIALLTKRAYDLAGCTGRRVKVELNGKKIQVSDFKQYVGLYFKETQNPTIIYESPNERWEVAVSISEGTFQQVSFVNSICTSKGGTHVNHVAEQLISAISGVIQKKHKKMEVKNHQIKQHLWLFVNALIVNPAFDSQTKETLTLKASAFGSKCEMSEKIVKEVVNSGIINNVLAYARAKNETQLQKKVKAQKSSKVLVPKLEDANDAGSRRSGQCTLILTEGDSAKSLAMAGLEIVGRDSYGVFPLKGKLLNVREASNKQLMNNTEIQNIMKIMGLVPKKNYSSLNELRYGSIMIMTDQDLDGSHIKGLILNFVHFFWPDLLKMEGFLKEFITPIIKAFRGEESISFFTIPEFEHWQAVNGSRNYRIKYYKGLGTSTTKEAKQYFAQLHRHVISFLWTDDTRDAESIELAFSKKKADDRKLWLARMDPETYLDMDITELPITDFVNKELILFSNYDNIRSIPSIADGLKPGQRKIMFTFFKLRQKGEIKVAQLSGSVAKESCYHHGEMSLASTIVGLAQNFVGSNNLNILLPQGQFGTRFQGGKDSASARYIFTELSPVTRHLFMKADDPLFVYQEEEGQKIEPRYYVPIIPMVLVNGADGIGTGWSTNVPCFNPIELIEAYRKKIDGHDFDQMQIHPWFKGYQGEINWVDRSGGGYEVRGKFERDGAEWLKITELPIRKWTTDYKEFLQSIINSDNNWITDMNEQHTTDRVDFRIRIPKLESMKDSDIIKQLKLSGSISMNNLVLFDHNRVIRKYANIAEIMQEHYLLREDYYNKRKEYLIAKLTRRMQEISNQTRFILMVVNNELIINKKRKEILKIELNRLKFMTKTELDNIFKIEESGKEKTTDTEGGNAGYIKDSEYNYLLGMAIWQLTQEKIDSLLEEEKKCRAELEELENTSIFDIWKNDLDELQSAIQEQWDLEEEERKSVITGQTNKRGGKGRARAKGKAAGNQKKLPAAKRAVVQKAVKKVEEPQEVKKYSQSKLAPFTKLRTDSDDEREKQKSPIKNIKPDLLQKLISPIEPVSDISSGNDLKLDGKNRKRDAPYQSKGPQKRTKKEEITDSEFDLDLQYN